MSKSHEMTEKIVCAAIHYDDGKDYYKENPHKPVGTTSGIVVCGLRHAHCIAQLWATIPDYQVSLAGRKAQGFLTTKNRFVSREDGFVIAKSQGQIIHNIFDGQDTGMLTSEDIY